jgi:hypothetical protein
MTNQQRHAVGRAVQPVDKMLGAEGKENVTEHLRRKQRSGVESSVWQWEAEKGKTLKEIKRPTNNGEEEEG